MVHFFLKSPSRTGSLVCRADCTRIRGRYGSPSFPDVAISPALLFLRHVKDLAEALSSAVFSVDIPSSLPSVRRCSFHKKAPAAWRRRSAAVRVPTIKGTTRTNPQLLAQFFRLFSSPICLFPSFFCSSRIDSDESLFAMRSRIK